MAEEEMAEMYAKHDEDDDVMIDWLVELDEEVDSRPVTRNGGGSRKWLQSPSMVESSSFQWGRDKTSTRQMSPA